MKSLKTKVIMSAIVLVFALVATIGSTYAWFTISNQVEVTTFDIKVESSETLLIKTYAGEGDDESTLATRGWTLADFSNSVSVYDGGYYDDGGAEDITAALLSPVTAFNGETVDGLVNNTDYTGFDVNNLRKPTANFLKPDVAPLVGRELATAEANSSSGGYIEVKFWLLKPSGDSTKVTFDYTIDDGSTGYADAIWFGTIDDSTEYVFGNNLDAGFTWVDPMPGTSNTSDLNSIVPASTGLTEFANKTGNASSQVMNLATPLVPQLMTVRIWAEGWDSDTVLEIMAATFSITLNFTLNDN